jgi:class III poly(R)-hydroxyalkanoic acid synthase PhaE subunit
MSKSKPTEAWLSGWQSMQEQFAEAWKDTAGAGQGAAPLAEGFAQWARLAGAGGAGNEALDRMVGGARQMVQMMQAALQQGVGDGGPSGADWTAAIASALGGIAPSDNPMLDALRQAAGEGARGFEQMFAEFGAAAAPLRRDFQAMLQMPAFGYQRESQERQQQFTLALDDYREQVERYNRLMMDASRRALEKLERKLAEHSEPGRQLKSWRELYDTWIDAAEEGYAEVALSPEFRHAYGALVNAQMRVRRHVQQQVERSAGQLGMPTRGELDAVHRKLGELVRRVVELEHAKGLAGIAPVAVPTAAPPPRKPAKAAKAAKAARSKRRAKPVATAPRARAAAAAPPPKKAGKPAARGGATVASSFAERLAAVRKSARKPRKGGR